MKKPKPGNKHSSNTITWANIETLGDNENLGVQFSEQGKLKDLDPDYQCAAELVRQLRPCTRSDSRLWPFGSHPPSAL